MLLNTPEGYISPELWDDGEPTLMASYALSGSSTRNRELGETSNYLFGNLQTAMTLGAWRFVTYDTLNLGNDIEDEGVDHLQAFTPCVLFAGINEMGQVPNFRKLLNTSSL